LKQEWSGPCCSTLLGPALEWQWHHQTNMGAHFGNKVIIHYN
jgi:hypothetical protein